MSKLRPEVAPFSAENLYKSLENGYATAAEIATHRHATYLFNYLAQIGAQTLVIEDPYVDGDYLDDFAVYYTTRSALLNMIGGAGDSISSPAISHETIS